MKRCYAASIVGSIDDHLTEDEHASTPTGHRPARDRVATAGVAARTIDRRRIRGRRDGHVDHDAAVSTSGREAAAGDRRLAGLTTAGSCAEGSEDVDESDSRARADGDRNSRGG